MNMLSTFRFKIESIEEGYSAYSNDIGGVITVADTLEDIIPNAIEAVELTLEGEVHPAQIKRRFRKPQRGIINNSFDLVFDLKTGMYVSPEELKLIA